MRLAASLTLALSLAACGGAGDEAGGDSGNAAVEPVAAPAAAPPPMPTAPGMLPAPELAGVAESAGEWRVDGDRARFAASDGRVLAIACARDEGRVRFAVSGVGKAAMLRLVTPSAATTLTNGPAGASLPVFDSFLSSLGRKGETIGAGTPEQVMLVAPAEPGLAALVARCRRP
ncbi:hypothetical protein [Sphingomonas sp.]